ncbi:short-chain collagen C4-like [Mytilus californianus]|uniref:short-chain collagen C4-like n=1 Tax=Mytilus californianus TaxID=6549 RepID=UPI0022480879|nr:short-chain collagen C4-like [Mytilus californianus]
MSAHVFTCIFLDPSGSIYVRWGRKECPTNTTEIVYTGIAAGGHYTNSGRPSNPVCVPHDPDLGQVSHESAFGSLFGMEYETNDFGSNLINKDVPCAVCRVSHASTVLMIPGKLHCYSGWKTEYSGNLMSGHYGHAGASQYICVDSSPDVLEAGSRDDNGYLLFGVKAYCGSLKCPPFVQDTLFKCVVCSK